MDKEIRLNGKSISLELYDSESEGALLGALLIDNKLIPHVLEELGENIEIFHHRPNQLIYAAIIEIFKSDVNKAIDPILLKDYLGSRTVTPEGTELKNGRTLLDLAGGFEYIGEIWEKSSAFINHAGYINIIREKFVLRRLISALGEIYNDTLTQSYDIDRVLELAETRIFDIVQGKKVKKSFSSMKDIIEKQVEYIENIKKTGGVDDETIRTGYELVDEITGGFKPGQLIIIAARPGMGKTAFALNIARNVAKTTGRGVAFFSLEMSEDEIARRFIFMQSKVRGHEAMKGYITHDDFKKVHRAAAELVEYPIFIDDTAGITPLQMKAKMRRLFAQREYGLVIVDYLQLMNTAEQFESMNTKITVISRMLKEIAKEFGVPVIALSQLSRSVERRDKKKPMLSDLRESGSIEQDADMVMFLYREEYYSESGADTADNSIEINIAKNRNGPIGNKKLVFLKEYGRFENLSAREGN